MAGQDEREMVLVAFLQAQNCSNFPASWRHPATMPDFMTPEYYQRIGRILEQGKFQLAFFDDRLAMPDRYGADHAAAVRAGVRVVKMDLVSIMTAMGMATSRLGIGGTYSTTYYEPFHVARVFATLDLMLRGRAAWNVVTSLNNSEAANFGHDEILAHDLRYERADEFMEMVLGQWGTWDDDAIVLDKESGVFADPAKVHPFKYEGKYLRSQGTFTVPRSPQGHPVIIQAGHSGRGRQFSARWADLVFVIFPNLETGQELYRNFKAEVVATGRDPAKVSLAPLVYPIVAETKTMAEDKAALIADLSEPIDTLALLSEALNFDFATKSIDEPFTADELENISGLHAIRDRVVRLSGKSNPTVRDFIDFSGRGTVREAPNFVGTAKDVADGMEEWFTGGACDGFVVAATHIPGSYEDFVRLVVPELQRRGLFRKDYTGSTLRENLGLEVPEPHRFS